MGLERLTTTPCSVFSSPKQEGKESLSLSIPLPVVPSPLPTALGCPMGAANVSGLSPTQVHL